jgi:hypothetical protein
LGVGNVDLRPNGAAGNWEISQLGVLDMRAVTGGAPGVSLADHWAAMRDNSALNRPANPSEAVATGDVHALMPPSKAHIKRLARRGLGNIPAPRAYPPVAPDRDARLDFHKRLIADLGGDLTVAPSPKAINERREQRVVWNYAPVQNCPPQSQAERRAAEDAAHDAERKRLLRASIIAQSRMVYTKAEPDMFAVIDAFGSIEAYRAMVAR